MRLICLHNGVIFIFTCFCSLSSGQQLKKITAWEKYSREPDSTLVVVKEYNEKGWLLVDDQPHYYCGNTYTYNDSGKVLTKEYYCGETIANGSSEFIYEGNTVCEKFSGGYDFLRCGRLDENGREVHTRDIRYEYDPGGDTLLITDASDYTHTYARSKNLITSHVLFGVSFYLNYDGNKKWISTDTVPVHFITLYTYNENDSLTSLTEINLANKNDTVNKEVFIYNKQGLKTEEWKYKYGVTGYNGSNPVRFLKYLEKVNYFYDKNKKLVRKEYYSQDISDKTKKEILETKEFYQSGKLVKTEEYNSETGKLYSVTRYYYEYWR